jgi:hypothetical protein
VKGKWLCRMVNVSEQNRTATSPVLSWIAVATNPHRGVLQGPQIEIRMGEVLRSTVVGRPVAAAPSSQCSRNAIKLSMQCIDESIVLPE